MDHHHHPHPPAALAGAIIAHYLRQLALAQGKRWTPANDRDMARLTELLGELGIAGESIPAFTAEPVPAPAERTTVAFDKPTDDPAATDPRFAQWREARRQADDRSIGRMLRSEGQK